MANFVKFFRNEDKSNALKKSLDFINATIKSSDGVIQGKVKFFGLPKITVVATEDVSTKKGRILNFGVARCTQGDEYDKEKGLQIANWRSEHDSQLKVFIPSEYSYSDTVAIFNANADKLNIIFQEKHNTHLLRKFLPAFENEAAN